MGHDPRADCEAIIEVSFRLTYMDGEVYRACRKFSFSPLALDRLEKRFGTRDFHEAAVKRTNDFMNARGLIRAHYYVDYLAVLALVDIGLRFQGRDKRVAAFDEMWGQKVGRSHQRHMLLARLFYYGKIGGWMKFNPGGTDFNARKIRGAAYDVALTMVNEEAMHQSDPRDPDVVMLLTRDRY
jgi:hypothetical protein